MRNKLLQPCLLLLIGFSAFAQQNVGIGTLTPNSKAMLEVHSPDATNDKGFLLPRMTTARRIAINPAPIGLIVYDTNDNLFYFWNGTTWKHYPQKPGDDGWIISGNNVYSSVSGNVGIGNSNPSAKLHVLGSVRLDGIGTTTVNDSVLTVDGNGNVKTRYLPSDIWDGDTYIDNDNDPQNECVTSILYDSGTRQLKILDACGQHLSPPLPFNPSDNDGDPTNEFQNLSSSSAPGGNVTINISDGTATTFSINDSDANATNEAQTLSISKTGIDISWSLTNVSGTGGGSGTFNVDDSDWDGAGTGKMYPHTLADNVGIGNNNPAHKLDVTGDILTSGKFYAKTTSYYMQSIDTSLQLFSNTNIKLQTNRGHLTTYNHSGSEALVNYSLNNQDVMTLRGNGAYAYAVGIGTQTPANKLQVAGDVRIGLINPAGFGNGGNASGNVLYFSGGPGFAGGFDSDNDDLIFMSRYNSAADESELRIGIGDDASQSSGTDRLSIGSYTTGGIGTFTGLFDFEVENPGSSNGPMLSIGSSSTAQKNYNGGLSITKPVGNNGQYINLARGALLPVWSIGYQYGTNRFAISEGTTNDASFATTPHFTIIPGGNIGLGVASPAYQLEISGSAAKPGGGMWTATSDERLKTAIKPFNDGLEIVKKINPVKFHYNGLAGMPTKEEYVGIIAQDIQKLAPYMIGEFQYQNEEGESESYLNYDGNAMTYILINAMKEQQQQIEQLQKQNTYMMQEILDLKSGNSTAKK